MTSLPLVCQIYVSVKICKYVYIHVIYCIIICNLLKILLFEAKKYLIIVRLKVMIMVEIRENGPLLKDGSIDLEQWLIKLINKISLSQSGIFIKGCTLTKAYGQDVTTNYGKTCLAQGLIVADILHELGLDVDSIVAGLIYYTYRYVNLSNSLIEDQLGIQVVKLIQGLQKIENIYNNNPLQFIKGNVSWKSLHNLRKLLLCSVDDIRVILIKLAIHTCEMQIAINCEDNVRRKLAYESQEIYAPLANRLGIGQLKWELEDLSFRFLEPKIYKNIAKLLDERRIDREKYIQETVLRLKSVLEGQGIRAELFGRAKHIFSIWKKMQRKQVGYNEIYDTRAIRILVPNMKDCYAALGVVHSLWQHIPKEFDDYIARPKGNGYQSLHTTVITSQGKILEIQIRTNTMHKEAELGIASHWRYKEGIEHEPDYEKKIESLRQLLNWQEELNYEIEDEDSLKAESLEDRIYVFTPGGEVIDLPKGATAIDFAYRIHTDIGHCCRGVKVNGKIVPISMPLINGMRVEILTAKEGGPSRDWLNPHFKYLITPKARSKVKQWFKKQDLQQNIRAGKDILSREFKRLGIDKVNLKELAEMVINIRSEEHLMASIGGGEVKVSQIINALQKLQKPLPLQIKSGNKGSVGYKEKTVEIMISGVGNLKCHMANCCNPIPGDEIIGYVTIGEGVSIHKKDCINILQISTNKLKRLIEVSWGEEIKNNYVVSVIITAYDRRGLLRDITTVLANEEVDVINMNTFSNKDGNMANFEIKMEVVDLTMLSRVLSRIQQISNIIDVKRKKLL